MVCVFKGIEQQPCKKEKELAAVFKFEMMRDGVIVPDGPKPRLPEIECFSFSELSNLFKEEITPNRLYEFTMAAKGVPLKVLEEGYSKFREVHAPTNEVHAPTKTGPFPVLTMEAA